jgi:hypothetical protein
MCDLSVRLKFLAHAQQALKSQILGIFLNHWKKPKKLNFSNKFWTFTNEFKSDQCPSLQFFFSAHSACVKRKF